MPPKKKSRPSYEVPEELQSAPQAGWVYRSDAPRSRTSTARKRHKMRGAIHGDAAPAATTGRQAGATNPAPKPAEPVAASTPIADLGTPKNSKGSFPQAPTLKPKDGIMDLATRAVSSGFEAMGTVVLLTTRIITAPISMGLRLLGLK